MTSSVKEASDAVGVAILSIFGFPLLIAVMAIWRGFVLTYLWDWFIVGYFHVPSLSIPLAIGISLVVGHMTPTNTDPNRSFATTVWIAVAGPALALLMGWIVQRFI